MPTEEKKYWCPHCDNEIERLNYNCNYTEYGNEWGSFYLESGNYESDERSGNDDETNNHEYECPECNASTSEEEVTDYSIEKRQEMESEDETEEIPTTEEKPKPEEVKPEDKITVEDNYSAKMTRKQIIFLKCEICDSKVELDNSEETSECPCCKDKLLTKTNHLIK